MVGINTQAPYQIRRMIQFLKQLKQNKYSYFEKRMAESLLLFTLLLVGLYDADPELDGDMS